MDENCDVVSVEPPAANGQPPAERPLPRDERPAFATLALGAEGEIAVLPARETRGGSFFRRLAVAVIVPLWITQFVTITVSSLINFPGRWDLLEPRIAVTVGGIAISLAILAGHHWARRFPLAGRVAAALLFALAGCTVHIALNTLIFHIPPFRPVDAEPITFISVFLPFLDRMWFYTALSVLLLALTYGADLAESQARNAGLQAQADAARLKALRYQLNPHFLFNTLNSVASLIGQRRAPEAEVMVVSLSDFLRLTLSLDPARQITLGEEIELQRLYLDIERTRFSHRLDVAIDLPADLRGAMVPSLILQPLVENAIKYGVARSLAPVRVEVAAAREGDRLRLEVRDDGDGTGPGAAGTRVGLRNVRERLKLSFGDKATLSVGRRPEGGFLSRIVMPLTNA
jgi:two-component system LytT family sensor kinase